MRSPVIVAGVLVAVLLGARTACCEEKRVARKYLTTREAAWFFGLRFADTGFRRIDGLRPPAALVMASFARLVAATGVTPRPYPIATGSRGRDGPRLGSYLRRARPRIARAFAQRYGASHGALFRLALDSMILAKGYKPGDALARETLSDMRAAMPVAGLPSSLLEPIRRHMHAARPFRTLQPLLETFQSEVRLALGQEEGKQLHGALAPTDPPRELYVWLIGGHISQALVLHVYGQLEVRPDVTAKIAELAKRLHIEPPEFPKRDPDDPAATTERALSYLLQTWATPIAQSWELRYSGRHRPLLAIPLNAISLRFSYRSGDPALLVKADFIRRQGRYAGLPVSVTKPFIDLLVNSASFAQVVKGLEKMLVDGETWLRAQERASGDSEKAK